MLLNFYLFAYLFLPPISWNFMHFMGFLIKLFASFCWACVSVLRAYSLLLFLFSRGGAARIAISLVILRICFSRARIESARLSSRFARRHIASSSRHRVRRARDSTAAHLVFCAVRGSSARFSVDNKHHTNISSGIYPS